MSTLSKLNAWQILGSHALQAVTGPEDEVVALEALTVVARALGLENEAHQVAAHVAEVRRVYASRKELREYFDGQLKLPLDGKDGAK